MTGQHRDLLAGNVVQVPRYAPALFILQLQESRGQLPQ